MGAYSLKDGGQTVNLPFFLAGVERYHEHPLKHQLNNVITPHKIPTAGEGTADFFARQPSC